MVTVYEAKTDSNLAMCLRLSVTDSASNLAELRCRARAKGWVNAAVARLDFEIDRWQKSLVATSAVAEPTVCALFFFPSHAVRVTQEGHIEPHFPIDELHSSCAGGATLPT